MRRLLACLLLAIGAGCDAPPQVEPEAPQRGDVRAQGDAFALLAAADEPGARLWAARVVQVRALDRHAFVAELAVEQALRGTPPTPARVAWEELAGGRSPRLAAGERVLLAAVPLPSHSLWRAREPGAGTFAIAADGRAFLRAPEVATLDALRAGLASEGALRWLEIGLRAEPRLAQAALARLAAERELAAELGGASIGRIRGALEAGHEVESLLRLIGAAGLDALRPEVEALAAAGSEPRRTALLALAELAGGLGDARVEALLGDADPALRALAARHATAPAALARVERLVRDDPSPEVRASGAVRLVEQRGLEAWAAVEPALLDPAPVVRAAAAQAIGSLGADAVPRLETLALRARGPQAAAAIAALAFAGPPARAALGRVAHTHPEPAAQRLANLVLRRELAARH